MTIPYPLIGPESYGLGRRSARRTPSTPGPNHIEPTLKESMSNVDACSKSSRGWKAKLSRKFHFP
ncbi:hypothetical protein BO70DRAFT_363426 [Aspergillus heteromorphus CBS 117.55]|uniref:Uncharacterized protein n=1 Tax=Aspergillus heteromorphus CBS 117.55 TaxID=1448321 RepID=A0A317VX65_9EURO|nr:uncharacterized protein BO70DRAFT_363426 [Aspergillus heteromorphus CBS 117.55]PWY77488.1 hypothetical protein BO70DRAFT_363426 [Aspergillus heteromorphus CBS 117.55]